MSKSLILWILIALLIVGGVIWLSRIDTTKETTRVEKIVPESALAK